MNRQHLYREAFNLLKQAQELLDAAGQRIRQRLAETERKAA